MAYAPISGAHVKTVGESASSAIDTTGADLIVVGITGGAAPGLTPAIADSKGNTYTGLTVYGSAGVAQVQLFYCQSPTVGSGHTFTVTANFQVVEYYVQAFSGSSPSPFDQENGGGSTGVVTSFQPGSITPSQANCLLVTVLAECDNANLPSIDSGFTITDSDVIVGASHYGGGLAYLIQGAAAAVNPTWSWAANLVNQQASAMASFKAAASTVVEVLRADADISDGSWTTDTGGTILYAAIDEVSADDADYIQSSLGPSNDSCEVSLSNPVSSLTTPLKVRYRYKKSDGEQIDLTVELVQGTTVIATWTHTAIGTTITAAEQTLSAPEAASITDFTDLRVRFTANAP